MIGIIDWKRLRTFLQNLFRIQIFILTLSLLVSSCSGAHQTHQAGSAISNVQPNIVIFYADDLGYGDVGAYGAQAIHTPNIDRLAKNGLLLTDAHAAAATCTPSRYALLTGEYGFRTDARILTGSAGALISPGKYTLPRMLQENGYKTSVIGKWHLGLGTGQIDWNASIVQGPLDIGFDYSFIIPATGDRVPTVYLENRKVVGLEASDPLEVSYTSKIGKRETGEEPVIDLRYAADPQHSGSVINNVSRIGYMKGGREAEWIDEDFADIFTEKAKIFIRENKDAPFFLYFPFHDPHVPRLPHPRFQGATKLGPRGDAVVQLDWMTGEVFDELEALGLLKNTIVIFTSDNGPVLNDGYEDDAVTKNGNHRPAGELRGGKYSAYEAGARVPTIVQWPNNIEPGQVSDALVSQVDLFASIAKLLNVDLRDTVAIDSRDELAAWTGKDSEGREILFKQSIPTPVLRYGPYKYIPPVDDLRTAGVFIAGKDIEGGASLVPQLYELDKDLSEQLNIAEQMPELIEALDAELSYILMRSSAVRSAQ